MSFDNVINEVQAKPELWMQSHPFFKASVHKAKVWQDIGRKLNMEEEKLKKRWKHLKDQYRKELKKWNESEDHVPMWRYFNQMSFMRDEMKFKPSGNDTSRTEEDPESIEFINTEIYDYANSPASPATSNDSQPMGRSQIKRKINEDLLEVEKKKVALMERKTLKSRQHKNLDDDEDFLYLKSILPSMRKLTDLQKLRFRGKINDWLIQALTDNQQNEDNMYYAQSSSNTVSQIHVTVKNENEEE